MKIKEKFISFMALLILILNIPLSANDTNWIDTWENLLVISSMSRASWNAGSTESYLSNNGYMVTVPYITNSNGEDADCLNFDLDFPSIQEYYEMENPYEDDNLRGIQYYSRVDKTLQNKYGLSDRVASYGRKIATWQWAYDHGVPGNTGQTGFTNLHGNGSLSDDESDRLIGYINELRGMTLPKARDFDIIFDGNISQTNPQSTTPMSINQNLPYKVIVSEPAYVTDVNGNRKTDFGAGESFIVNAPPQYIGNMNVRVETDQVSFGLLLLRATVNGKQDILHNSGVDPLNRSKEVNLNFEGALGKIRFKKEMNQNTTVPISVDPTAHKIRLWNTELGFDETYSITNTWFTDWYEIVIGTYDYEEITYDGNTRRVDYKGKVTIEPQAELTQLIINEPKQNALEILKELENPTNDKGNSDYKPTDNLSKIKVNVKGRETHFTYNATHNLDNKGYKKLERMNAGTYEIQETFVPDDMELNNTVQTVEVKDSETASATIVHISNKLKWAKLNIIKKDNNGGYVPNVTYTYASSLMKDEKGNASVWTWDITTNSHVLATGKQVTSDGTYYNRVDESTIIGTITTSAEKDNETDAFLYGYKTVYVQEVSVPSTNHILINRTVKAVTLKPNETVEVSFLNILKDGGVIQVQKDDEDGNLLEWYFPVYKVNENGTKTYIETIVTSKLNGIGNSTFLQFVEMDSKGNARSIAYEVCEQAHPLYKPQECVTVTKDDVQPNTSVIIVKMTNYYKDMQFVLPKVAEKNIYNENADGSEFEIINTITEEVLAIGISDKDLVIFSKIRVDKIVNNENLGYREVKQAEHFKENTEVYKIPVITEDELLNYMSDSYYYLRPKDDPFINEFKEITVGTKATSFNGGKTIKKDSLEIIYDDIDLCYAIKDKQYTFVGYAMDKRTGEPLVTVDGLVKQSHTFIAKGGCEVITMRFEINTTGFTEDVDIVFFEDLYYNPTDKPIDELDEEDLVAYHRDIEDENQTIQLRMELVETGQNIVEKLLLGLTMFMASFMAFLFNYFRKKKGNRNVKND